MNALTDIHNFLPLWGEVATSGQPTEEQLPAVTNAGFEVVINLLPESELLANERAFFQATGNLARLAPGLKGIVAGEKP